MVDPVPHDVAERMVARHTWLVGPYESVRLDKALELLGQERFVAMMSVHAHRQGPAPNTVYPWNVVAYLTAKIKPWEPPAMLTKDQLLAEDAARLARQAHPVEAERQRREAEKRSEFQAQLLQDTKRVDFLLSPEGQSGGFEGLFRRAKEAGIPGLKFGHDYMYRYDTGECWTGYPFTLRIRVSQDYLPCKRLVDAFRAAGYDAGMVTEKEEVYLATERTGQYERVDYLVVRWDINHAA